MTRPINPARKKAIENGDIFYEGNPCKKAGHTMRYTISHGCVLCHTDRPGVREARKIARNNGEIKYITRCLPCNEDTEHWTRNSGCVKCQVISQKWSRVKYDYGITKDEWFWLLKEQYGKCKICKKVLKVDELAGRKGRTLLTACVDHDHKTDRVRGLLCGSCNLLIGLAEDNVSILNSAIIYLNDTTRINVI